MTTDPKAIGKLTDDEFKVWQEEQAAKPKAREIPDPAPHPDRKPKPVQPTRPVPAGPKETYLHFVGIAQGFAALAADNAHDACDWYGIFDKDTAAKYREAAASMTHFADHLASLLEQEQL